MFTKFDDSSLDATRRSIFFYSILSVALFHYRPEVDLTNLLEWIEFKNNIVTPATYGTILFFALSYLFLRLIFLMPLHVDNRDKNFSKQRETISYQLLDATKEMKGVNSNLTEVQNLIEKIDNTELIDACNKYVSAIPEYFSEREKLEHARDEIVRELQKVSSTIRATLDTESDGKNKKPDPVSAPILEEVGHLWNDFLNRTNDLLVPTNTAYKRVKEEELPELRFPSSVSFEKYVDIEDSVLRKIRDAEKRMILVSDQFKDEISNIRNASNNEVRIFSNWVPKIAVSIGLSASACTAMGVDDIFKLTAIALPITLVLVRYTAIFLKEPLQKQW